MLKERLSQKTFSEAAIEVPGEPHLACVLLLDTSGSMNEKNSISVLNRALRNFICDTEWDDITLARVDLCIIEFNDEVHLVRDFVPLGSAEPITLSAHGMTSMGKAIDFAIDKVKERNRFYYSVGTPCYQPWIVMMTDGEPTDDVVNARQRIKEEENKGSHGKLKFWSVGVPGYSRDIVSTLSKRCIEMTDNGFDKFFDWLRESVSIISVSNVNEMPQLPMLPENARIIPTELC